MFYWQISYSDSYLEPHAFGGEMLQCQNQKYMDLGSGINSLTKNH